MQISVTDAKSQLTELVRRAEAGEEVILTRHGHAAVRLVPVTAVADKTSRRAALAKCARLSPTKPMMARMPRMVRIFSMTSTAFRNDRYRYVGSDGDPA